MFLNKFKSDDMKKRFIKLAGILLFDYDNFDEVMNSYIKESNLKTVNLSELKEYAQEISVVFELEKELFEEEIREAFAQYRYKVLFRG
ncbi:hypothetical protein [Campylobacter geochelonis]|uniref:hypothetical protein n=1 Tax=Campylobacter geochelonis TaxID=1780362 RepID=UPI00077073A2|nr:hypothetical protein [Campylobacter geochelonis]CZE48759.1 Uncharacterised protein [Campylobacter geochelonis]CZE51338.1 Uncharacterised protein [Campylobacter geochelonis]